MKISSLTKATQFHHQYPTIEVLFQTKFRKELKIAFQKFQVMQEHSSPFPIILEVVDGTIELGINKEIYVGKKGDLISLEANIPHHLRALETSIVRLSLSKPVELLS